MDELFDRHSRTGEPELREEVERLLAATGNASPEKAELQQALLWSVVRLIQDDTERWDMKIACRTLSELGEAFDRLRRFKRRRKVTVFGSARTLPEASEYGLATALGRLLASHEYMVITGAGGGVMQAAHEGAGRDYSLGFNISLPFEQQPNPVMRQNANYIEFRFFFTRKLFFAKEADALVAFPGGFGTLDETLELLTLMQTGKSPLVPFILMEPEGGGYWQQWKAFVEQQLDASGYINATDLSLIQFANHEEEALGIIRGFYKNYHSMREVDGLLRMRLAYPPAPGALKMLDRSFGDLCRSGGFSVQGAHPAEAHEPELDDLVRLVFDFNGRDYGRLRELIDFLNKS